MARPHPTSHLPRLGGVASRRELLQLITKAELDACLASGQLVKVGQSQIALPAAADAVAIARRFGGVLAGESAALHWGWKVKSPPPVPVVLAPRNHGRSTNEVKLVRRDVPAGWTEKGALNRAATVVDCARRIPFDSALAVADSALRSRQVTAGELGKAADALSGRFQSRVTRVLDAASPLAANPFESVARAIADEVPGLRVRPQVSIVPGERCDLVDETLRIVIECDSWEFHSGEELFRRDVRRYTRLTVNGWLVIRLTWEDVMFRPDWVRAHLSAAVEAACHARFHTFGLTARLPSLNEEPLDLNV